MMNRILLLPLLAIFAFSCHAQDLFRKGVWGSYTWGSLDDWDGSLTKENFPHVTGFPIVLKWSDLEPEDGVYKFDELLGEKLKHADQENFYTFLTVWVGPMSPTWIYDKGVPLLDMEKTINPLGKVRTWKFPYYLDEDYKGYFHRMINKFGEYYKGLPDNLKKRVVFIQSAEGSTGDGWPYKGKPLDLKYDISRDQWTPFRLKTWESYRDAFNEDGKTVVPILTNYDSCTAEEYDWLLNNMPAVGLKNGMFSHGYHISYAKTRLASWNAYKARLEDRDIQFFSRGEQDREWEVYGWSTQNPEQGFYWSSMYATHTGLSMWNIPSRAIRSGAAKAGMEFFNKYANQHDVRTATAAFCAMRKGLDASDLNSFPESIYGKADMKNLDRYLKIAQKYKDFGAIQGDPEKAAGIIHLKLGDATESDSVSQAYMTTMGMINRKRQDFNDVGWGILDGNYCRFLKQIDPDETSIGLWHKGPVESIYSRFARSTDVKNGKDAFYFDLDDAFQTKSERIHVKLIWLDEGTTEWKLCYNAPDQSEKVACFIQNKNSGEWLEKTVTINDFQANNKGRKGADLIVENTGEQDLVFHFVEVEIP